MPDLIETRPFTIQPELFAGPSFRVYGSRLTAFYILVIGLVTLLLWKGIQTSLPIAFLLGVGITAALVGLNFVRYKGFLMKPENRALFQNCVVSLNGDEVRQDYTDGSYTTIKLFAIRKFREVGDFYFVLASKRHGIVVPKHAFESAADSAEFADKIREGAGKK